MAGTKSFQDLIVWQKSQELSLVIYRLFRDVRDYGFKDQIQRAAVSTMNNVAEGYARRSDKALRNFLCIAKGSAAEVESMLYLSEKLHYVNKEDTLQGIQLAQDLQMLLSGFIRKL